MKPYRKWLRNTEVSLAAVLVLIVLVCNAQAKDPVEAAKKAAEGVLKQIGTEQGIQDRLVNPLVNKGSELTTLDGKQTFAGQLQCKSSGKFLQISLISLAQVGDLTAVHVRQDIDLNDALDYVYPVPVSVSGICGNGLISCQPGIWNNCRYYKWQANSTVQLSLAETGITALKGCYCVNASCNYKTNIHTALKAIGKGAVNAVSARLPKVSVTDTQVIGTAIVYSAQDTETCTTVETLYGSKKPEYYYSHTGKIESGAAGEVASQKADPESPYSLIVNSLAWNKDALKDYYESCTVERKEDIDQVQTFCDEAAPSGQLGSAETNKMYKVKEKSVYQAQCGCAYTAVKYCPAPQAEKAGSAPPHGKFYGSGAENFQPAGNGCNYDEVWLYNVCRRFSDVFKNKIVDHCAALQAQCKLKDEVVDGVQTYKDYNPTGKQPGQSCKTLKGNYGTYKVCKPWWVKQRVYHCEKEGETFEFARQRVEVVTSSASDSGGVMAYDDHRLKDGVWVDESHSSKLPPKQPHDECEISCKVRKPSQDTQAGISGHAGQFKSSVDGYDYFVKPCRNNVCPLATGEELVDDCQCLNEFVHAVTQMEVMKESGKNMKCDGKWDESGNCTGQISIFTGHEGACRTPGLETNWFDCCNSKPESWLIFKKFCTEEEKTTVQAMENMLVHYVGKRCAKDLPLVGCVQEEKVYCKFQALLGRIIQQQGRPQLKAFGQGGSWGNGEYPNCRGLSPEELQRINFSKINFSEFIDHIKTKAMGEIEEDMKDKVGDFYDGIQ